MKKKKKNKKSTLAEKKQEKSLEEALLEARKALYRSNPLPRELNDMIEYFVLSAPYLERIESISANCEKKIKDCKEKRDRGHSSDRIGSNTDAVFFNFILKIGEIEKEFGLQGEKLIKDIQSDQYLSDSQRKSIIAEAECWRELIEEARSDNAARIFSLISMGSMSI